MRRLLIGECAPGNLYDLSDPDAPTEAEFEKHVAAAFCCVYPSYRCLMFDGLFKYDDRSYRPDLALVAKDLSHWFVVEVELAAHSFEGHVLPQVRAFRYGEPQPNCAKALAEGLGLDVANTRTLVQLVPRGVAVVANRYSREWDVALRALETQFLTVSVFRSPSGIEGLEIDGTLEVGSQHLGFGKYSATDRAVRFGGTVQLPLGSIQINDPSGVVAFWTVDVEADATWVRKEVGTPTIPHDAFVQLMRTRDGRLALRLPT